MSESLIYRADAFRWLRKQPEQSFHAVVTDPPYAVIEYLPDQMKKRDAGKGGIWRLPHNYNGHVRNPLPRFTVLSKRDHSRIKSFQTRLASELIRVLVPGSNVVIASNTLLTHHVIAAFLKAGFELRGQIARSTSTMRGGDRPKGAHDIYQEISVTPRSCWEPWLLFRKPCEGRVRDNLEKFGTGGLRRPDEGTPFKDLFLGSAPTREERRIAPHPSLKPQWFLRDLVRAVLPTERGILLDPFMGSGSTIAAAAFHSLAAVGVEKDESYFRMAYEAIPKLFALGNGPALFCPTPKADELNGKPSGKNGIPVSIRL